MNRVDVDCQPVLDGWMCIVEVADDRGSSQHTVRVGASDLDRLDPTAADATDLVRRSFDFLLRREPKESILASFDITVIARYFPDYEADIRRRV